MLVYHRVRNAIAVVEPAAVAVAFVAVAVAADVKT